MKKKLIFISLILTNILSAQTLVKNIAPGEVNSNPRYFYKFDKNRVIFFANEGWPQPPCESHQSCETFLYISDGTNSGTFNLANLGINYANSSPYSYYGFTKIDSFGYIIAQPDPDSLQKFALVKTDGTIAGTQVIPFYEYPQSIRGVDTRFFKLDEYICWLGLGGSRLFLWKFNPTTSNLSNVEIDISSNWANSHLFVHNKIFSSSTISGYDDILYEVLTDSNGFFLYSESQYQYQIIDTIFKIDINGNKQIILTTNNKQYMPKNARLGFPNSFVRYSNYDDVSVLIGNKYLFTNGEPNNSFGEPYYFDLSNKTFGILKDINPYFNYTSEPYFFPPTLDYGGNPNNVIYFSAYDVDHGREIWVTDGTPAGTTMVKDFLPGPPSLYANDLEGRYFGDTLVSFFDDSILFVTPTEIIVQPIASEYWYYQNPNSDFRDVIFTWKYNENYYFIDYNGNIFGPPYNEPIVTIKDSACTSSSSQLNIYNSHSITEINGCLILEYMECGVTGYELFKYCNNNIYSNIKNNLYYNDEINIYPNPCSNEFLLKSPFNLESASIHIFDITGNPVKSINNVEGNDIKVSSNNLSNGIYFLMVIQKDKKVGIKKLMILN
jgi:ELWxxDGT repeat protein